jgi:membrane protease YdiL (CAAX protease family)
MALIRFVIVSGMILAALILHELHSEKLFSSFPILAEEIGWWLIGLLLVAYIIVVERKGLSSVGIRKVSPSTISTAAIGFGLALLGVAAFGLIIQLTGIDPTSTEERLGETASAPLWWLILVFLRAGVVEELIFRGFIISRLIEFGASRWLTLLMSTFLFVLPHALFWPGPALILVAFHGLAFGTIFIWKRDLLACVLAHIGINIGGVIASILA